MTPYKIHRTTTIAAGIVLLVAGCKSKPADDAALTTEVQARLAFDQSLTGQPVQASVANGVVTLDGTVTSDAARSTAAEDAAQITGVRTVVNNLTVQPASGTVAEAAPPLAPAPASSPAKPSASVATSAKAAPTTKAPAPIERAAPQAPPPPPPQPMPAPVQAQTPPPPPPPPQPVEHRLTLDAGTVIPVRITQTLDSATTQTGDKFTGAIATDLIVEGLVALPQGTAVSGHVDAAQDAAHFKGSSLLTISLSGIDRKGEHLSVVTDAYTKQGEGRGKNTAEKVGGGAAVGAVLGGIFGGGKGAAIGAAAGGGVGAGAQGVTRGQQVQIPSETVVRFRLSDPVVVHITTMSNGAASGSSNHTPILERHE
jgi:hypothetical protein